MPRIYDQAVINKQKDNTVIIQNFHLLLFIHHFISYLHILRSSLSTRIASCILCTQYVFNNCTVALLCKRWYTSNRKYLELLQATSPLVSALAIRAFYPTKDWVLLFPLRVALVGANQASHRTKGCEVLLLDQ